MRTTTNNRITPPTAEDYELAKKTFAWMESLVDSKEAEGSDYLHNLSIYGKTGTVNHKGLGIVASAVSSFLREEEKRASRRDFSGSRFIGTEGERLTVRATITAIFPTTYGFMTKLLTEDGNVIAAFEKFTHVEDGRGKEPGTPAVIGDVIWVKGTVKRHSEYKGIKETQLNRAEATIDPAQEKARKAAAAKANKRVETKAGELVIGGITYIAWDITRANGEVVGWNLRTVAEGKKKQGELVAKTENGVRFADRAGDDYGFVQVLKEVEAQQRKAARDAFGAPVKVATYAAVRYSQPSMERPENVHFYAHGHSDLHVWKLSATEYKVVYGPATYNLGAYDKAHQTEASARAEIERGGRTYIYRDTVTGQEF